MSDERLGRFRLALERNAAEVVGPVATDEVGSFVAARAVESASGTMVAVPGDDEVLDRFGVVDALVAAGASVLRPDHPDWRGCMATARVGVTGSVAAAAETGTIGLACGPGAPRAVSLTPDVHLCVVPTAVLEDDLGAALSRALTGGLPPNLVWVSGPSRSADIEKRITLGVHGPRTLTVVLADGSVSD
ncbi:MAG TPA: lactate utilization protein [Acidimicrobiia bacterium]|nr:lactate utilization protein [Acidimicrobiia bacterium]